MARRKHVEVEELSELIQCPTCFEPSDDPRSLPCHHWVCRTCLIQLIRQASSARRILCPSCRVVAPVPSNGASGFPVAFWVNKLKEITVREPGRDGGSDEIWCAAHRRECEMFCTDCNRLICGKCCASDHKDHSKVHAEEIVGQHRESIQQSLDEFQGILKRFDTSFKELKEARHGCKADCKVAKKMVSKHADDVIKRIQGFVVEKHRIFETETAQYVSDIERSKEKMKEEFDKLNGIVRQNESSVKCENAAVVVHTSVNRLPEQRQVAEGAMECPSVSRMKIQLHCPDVDHLSSEMLLGRHEFVTHSRYTAANTQHSASLEAAEGGASSAEDFDTLFPSAELVKLDEMVTRPQWIIPVLPGGELEVVLNAALSLTKQGLDIYNDDCQKFYTDALRVSFTKMYNGCAVKGWKDEIHKCILTHSMKLIELCVMKMDQECVPLLELLALVLDPQSTFHCRNRERPSQSVPAESTFAEDELFARPSNTGPSQGWLVDMVNKFGELNGFQLVLDHLTADNNPSIVVTAALIRPFAQCFELLTPHTIRKYLLPITKFVHTKDLSTIKKSVDLIISHTPYENAPQ